ncbi:hypothetical protein [Micromonospora endolithica]|nr:hypothetical protein [Micromonospora endolithica]
MSLEDFHRSLTDRLAEAERALRKLNAEMQCRPPALGTFTDATDNARRYSEIHRIYTDHVVRLRTAVQAARDASAAIIANYRTTEARNTANSSDIITALAGVDAVLPPIKDDHRV